MIQCAKPKPGHRQAVQLQVQAVLLVQHLIILQEMMLVGQCVLSQAHTASQSALAIHSYSCVVC